MDQLVSTSYLFVTLFSLISGSDVPGVPDDRNLKIRISRGSGMGAIPFYYAIIVLLAFGIFVFLMGLALCYKRERGIRNSEKTLFLSPY